MFLLAVSESMNSPDKLPLVKSAMKILLDQLDENDRVAIAVYVAVLGLAAANFESARRNSADILFNSCQRPKRQKNSWPHSSFILQPLRVLLPAIYSLVNEGSRPCRL